MAGLAKGRPQVHPNAALAGLPQRLRPPPNATSPRTTSNWPGLPPASGDATYLLDRDQRLNRVLSGNLEDAIYRLKRVSTSIRDLIRQHESAWMSLRLLYNSVVILQKLLERLRDMFRHLSQIESVAKEVNVYEPEELDEAEDSEDYTSLDEDGDGEQQHREQQRQQQRQQQQKQRQRQKKSQKPASPMHGKPSSSHYEALPSHGCPSPTSQQSLSPMAWSNRVLPKVEQMLSEFRTCIVDIEGACRSAVLRRQTKLMPDPDAVPLRWSEVYIQTSVRKLGGYQLQLETHMLSCKYIHMVSAESLYTSQSDGFSSSNGDYYYHQRLPSSAPDDDQPAFYTFWSGMDLATAAKRHRDKAKKKYKKSKGVAASDGTTDRTGKTKGRTKTTKDAKGKAREEPTQAPASKEDLLAAIDRKDYLTVVTMLMSDMSLNEMLEDGTFLLSHAVDDDNSALVSILAMCGADPNVRHRSGNTPLHFASYANCVASALLLIELGAKVDVRDVNGLTPLHVACRERNASIVLQLLAHGADPNICDNRGLTPLAYALLNLKKPVPSRDILTVLLTYGARATGRGLLLQPFIESILRYDSTLMCNYLKAHPDIIESEMLVATTGGGDDNGIVRVRPLYAAILIGNIFAIDQLLRKGADVHHISTSYGKTTSYLSLAVQSDSTSIVSRLLFQNADPNVANNRGRTPLHLASASLRGELEVAKLLLRHGADPLAATHDRQSQALHMAVRVGRADVCDLLLKKGAPIDQPLRSGITPLMLAVYHNNRIMMRFLMSRGANVRYATPIYGETAMHTACRVGNISLAALLLSEGLSVNAEAPFPPPRRQACTSSSVASTSSCSSSSSSPNPQSDSRGDRPVAGDDGDIGNGNESDTDSDVDSNDTLDEDDLLQRKQPHADSRRNSTSTSVTATTSTGTAPVRRSVCGYAPIHAAASRGHIEMVRWLLANSADPEARIGRVAANMCLGKDRLKGKGKDKTGSSSSGSKVSLDDVHYEDDASDPGETPVEIARIFGHDRTAAVIQDAILAASPAVAQYLATPSPPPSLAPPHGPPGQPHRRSGYASNSEKHPSQYSLETSSDSTDEGDAMMEELHRAKTVPPPPHPAHSSAPPLPLPVTPPPSSSQEAPPAPSGQADQSSQTTHD
ncbi:hypothetical protein SCUCBS95973_003307 [Sporothrix curviconia]|uniref:Ankyrin repeat protein n=1 Tax=Sporothrix curviconia TaxID=1260050 RepID=A0ABP0BEJ2_9PEZI